MAGKRDEVTIAEVAGGIECMKNNGIPRNIRQGPRERGYRARVFDYIGKGRRGCRCAAAHCAGSATASRW